MARRLLVTGGAGYVGSHLVAALHERGDAVVVLDPEQIRAAVTVALDAAMPGMVDHISERVLAALSRTGKKSNA